VDNRTQGKDDDFVATQGKDDDVVATAAAVVTKG
jgi:hypothetical protein